MDAVVYGWTMGKRARALFGVRWNDLWSVPLSEVRARLGVVVDEPDSITRAAA
jgi:ubiquinone biosynthesis protein Coq4